MVQKTIGARSQRHACSSSYRVLTACLLSISMAALFAGCGGGGSSSENVSTSTQPAVSITSAGSTTVDAGDTVTLNATVSNDPGNGGVTWTLSSNPMSSSSTTTTSATFVPSVSNTGKLSYTVTATSKDFSTVSNSITIAVNALPTVTSSGSVAIATEGSSYSATLNESGGTGTLTWTLAGGTSLPAGLTLNSNGTITGTPTGPAGTNFTFNVQVLDSDTPTAHSSASAPLTISVNNYPLPTFSASTLPNGAIGQSYSQSVSIVGGHAPFTIVTEGVPGGVATTVNGSSTNVTGTPVQTSAVTFSGAPTQLGNNFPVTILVSDSSNPVQYNSITYYVNVSPSGNPPAEIVADASQVGPAMAGGQLGSNAPIFYPDISNSAFSSLWSSAGLGLFRYPGGTQADYYHWENHSFGPCSPYGGNPPSATTLDALEQATIVPLSAATALTVNYGTNADCTGPGDPNEAAAWVNYANNTQHYGVKYWTVGNEEYNTGEPDLNTLPHDPATYANQVASQFYPLMKAQDSTIMVGVDTRFGNGVYSASSDAWDPIVLANAKYDFVEIHYYPEFQNQDNDATLLTSWSNQLGANFSTVEALLAASGHPAAPIYLGEFDRDSGNGYIGHESVSIVNALFNAIVVGEMTKAGVALGTQFMAVDGCWPDSLVSPASTAYGLQDWGSWGLFATEVGSESLCTNQGVPEGTPFPKARAFQILSQYVLAGEHVIAVASTDPSVRAYAATNQGGYALLLINTDETSTHTLPVTINNASGSSYTETTLVYGKAQYDLSESGTWAGAVSANLGTVGTTFSVSLPPWSITLVQLH